MSTVAKVCASLVVVISAFPAVIEAVARDLPPIRTIGVISDVGNRFSVIHIGFMAFTNAEGGFDTPEWKIDDFVMNELQTTLANRFEFHKVNYQSGSIAPNLDDSFWSAPNPKDNVRDHATPSDGQPVDAYLVVWPWRHDLYPVRQNVQGLGLLTMGGYADIFVALRVTLVDGRTFKEIDDCGMRMPRDKRGRDFDTWSHKEFYVEKPEQLTAEQRAQLEPATKEAVRAGIAYCLDDLKLMR